MHVKITISSVPFEQYPDLNKIKKESHTYKTQP